ncbi:hypothetical protein BpHYR1_032096 [Brachionus plicatilis]|uniref:Uncharacterized protein n=1 Tax=Brachionus plicatilis TaxID=10195 RepID=A0A3M7T0Q0_BRAPC|nr:hypothetical protein BpHYR1_032096 [Brachionus plicatilis]
MIETEKSKIFYLSINLNHNKARIKQIHIRHRVFKLLATTLSSSTHAITIWKIYEINKRVEINHRILVEIFDYMEIKIQICKMLQGMKFYIILLKLTFFDVKLHCYFWKK